MGRCAAVRRHAVRRQVPDDEEGQDKSPEASCCAKGAACCKGGAMPCCGRRQDGRVRVELIVGSAEGHGGSRALFFRVELSRWQNRLAKKLYYLGALQLSHYVAKPKRLVRCMYKFDRCVRYCAGSDCAGSLPLAAQHDHPAPEKLGLVDFPIACSAAVQPEFNRAVALLHSFAYSESEKSFREVLALDPTCAMAHWGIAMSYYHQLWEPPLNAASYAKGAAELAEVTKTQPQSAREAGFIAALECGLLQCRQAIAARADAGLRRQHERSRKGQPARHRGPGVLRAGAALHGAANRQDACQSEESGGHPGAACTGPIRSIREYRTT